MTSGAIARINTASNGAQASGPTYNGVFSPDGSHILFSSGASNLVPGDTNSAVDLFLKNTSTGVTTRINTSTSGSQADKGFYFAIPDDSFAFSPDGSAVAFLSDASNLAAGDTVGTIDIFIKELATGVLTRIPLVPDGTSLSWGVDGFEMSPDGTHILFRTRSAAVAGDTNDAHDIFLKNLSTGEIRRISVLADGSQANGDSQYAVFSPDGNQILFNSIASNLVPNDTNNTYDLFIKDLTTNALSRVSVTAGGLQANGWTGTASFSQDGKHIVFDSLASNLVAGDTNGNWDIFTKDLETGEVVRVNTAADGAQAAGFSDTPVFSPDGRRVMFRSSAANLVPNDTNGVTDLFIKDLESGAIIWISTTADGSQGNGPTRPYATFSPDGRNALFPSDASNLVTGDSNGGSDIFLKTLPPPANKISIRATQPVQAESNTGSTAYTFTVTRSGDTTGATTADWSVSGLAAPGVMPADASDFDGLTFPSGSVTFTPGETQRSITVLVRGDTAPEMNERFVVTLANPSPGATIETASARGTILTEDGSRYSIGTSTFLKPEGTNGSTSFSFTVTRAGLSHGTDTLDWSVSGGTMPGTMPVNAADFVGGVLPSGSLTFARGENRKTITVAIQSDALRELNESFTVTLSNPSPGAAIGRASATVGILDDDTIHVTGSNAAGPLGNDDPLIGASTVGLLGLASTADLQGAISRLTTSATGAQANDHSGNGYFPPIFSPDGTQVLFGSWASNLVPGDTNGYYDLFLRNLATGAITRLNTADDGTQAIDVRLYTTFSPDGTRVLFASTDPNLAPADTNGIEDIFIKNLATGAVERVNTAADGTEANSAAIAKFAFSPDGTRVLFASGATNLVPGDTNEYFDLFVKNLATGAITRVDTAANGAQANEGISTFFFSPDGNSVLFDSAASNLVPGDTNGSYDIFVKNLTTGAITRVNTAANGAQANNGSFGGFIFSPTGNRVLFQSAATNLVPGDTNGAADLFVKNLATGAIARVSTAADGTQANNDSLSDVSFSPDGTRILFRSRASNLVPGDTNGAYDIFLKNLTTGAIVRVNTAADGTQASAGSDSAEAAFSPDSTRVVFVSSASNLVPGDTAGTGGIFVKDLATGAITRINTAADGTPANGPGNAPVWSPDGTHMVFTSIASNLVPGDTNARDDIFIKSLVPATTTLAIAPAQANRLEGDAGATAFTFTVTRGGDTAGTTSVSWLVSGLAGSSVMAASANDFVGLALPFGTVTFAPGETERSITVLVHGDADPEMNERFLVTLASPSLGAAIEQGTAHGTIRSDDGSRYSIGTSTFLRPEGTGDTTSFSFSVTRAGLSQGSDTLDWSVSGGGMPGTLPANGADFPGGDLPSGSLTFAPGENRKTITVAVQGDSQWELNESFTVTLANPSSGAAIGRASATAGIIDDDTIHVTGSSTTGTDGNDYFLIGPGTHSVSGLGGTDRFVLANAGSTTTLQDFAPNAGERIDLRPIDAIAATLANDSFTFIGAAAFSGTPGQLRASIFSAGLQLVAGDLNGDSTSDFTLLIASASPAQPDWFLL